MPLTDRQITAAQPREKKHKLFDEKGLFLLVLPGGGKYWKFKYSRAGRGREVSFGAYPEVSLKVARDRRDEERRRLAQGVDPPMLQVELFFRTEPSPPSVRMAY
jgi:hypothetical protein